MPETETADRSRLVRSDVTLLFTDLVGSTELAQRLGEDAAEEFRRLHFKLLREAFAPLGGREVKNLGDGLMVVFDEASDALAAGVAMQRAVAEHNRTTTGTTFSVRVGVQAGQTVLDDGDYFGTPVIVAKRLCDRACAGQILSTEFVAGRAGGDTALRALGALELKGLSGPVEAVEVMWDGVARSPEPASASTAKVVRPPGLAPPPDRFVGRDTELAELTALLRRSRLVTIIGPGGVGKTRLSGHLVDNVAADYPDGVWCCELAAVSADDQVPDAVATALQVERRAGVGLVERLVEFLAPKRALLVLDNCEQVIDGAADLCTAVLAGTTGIDILATSREALSIPGEYRVVLAPLSVDSPTGDPAPAVALFLERAVAAGRRMDPQTHDAVRDLCDRVDGFPLAIELAAAQVASRTIPEIITDVTDRLAQLSVRRGRTERHRSIHALVDWSYDLLDDRDRRLFENLAVFAGGADADAVAAVVAQDRRAVTDRLQALADRSMVSTRLRDTSTRFGLLGPVRAYAEERLRAGDDRPVRDAHAGYFAGLAEQIDERMRHQDEIGWATRFDDDLPNLRAAQAWSIQSGNPNSALRIAAATFWCGWGRIISEVHTWAEQAADRFGDSGHPCLPGAWATAACGAWLRGDLAHAASLADRGFSAVPTSDPPCPQLFQIAGNIAIHSGDFERAVKLYQQGHAIAEAAGDELAAVGTLTSSALATAYAGRIDDAVRLADRALEQVRGGGGGWSIAMAYYTAGEVRLEAAPAEAGELLALSLEAAARDGDRFTTGSAGLSMLSVHARLGDLGAALPRYPDLIEHWQRAGAWNQLWLTLRNLVETLELAGHGEQAAVLYGAMRASARSTPVAGADAVRLAGVMSRLEQTLGATSLTHHQERGAALGDTGAVTYAVSTLRELLG